MFSNSVISPQRAIELIAVTKLGAGTPTLSGLCAAFCSVVDNGVGDYTIVVNTQRPGAQTLIAAVLPHSPGVIHKVIASSTKLQIRVKCFAVDGTTPAELNFDLIVMGSDAQTLLG
jgi:nucleotide-binding universal stress UspA family protein